MTHPGQGPDPTDGHAGSGTVSPTFVDIDSSGTVEPDEQWVAYLEVAEAALASNDITPEEFSQFLANRAEYYNYSIAEGTTLADLILTTYAPSSESVEYSGYTPASKLTLNNGNLPVPAATDQITLREFEEGPMAQIDAERNFLNLTDRVNTIINNSASTDAALSSSIASTNQAIATITNNLTSITSRVDQAETDVVTNRDTIPSSLESDGLAIDTNGNMYQATNKKILIGTSDDNQNATGAVLLTGLGNVATNDPSPTLLVSSLTEPAVTLSVAGTIVAERILSVNSGYLDIATLNTRLETVEQGQTTIVNNITTSTNDGSYGGTTGWQFLTNANGDLLRPNITDPVSRNGNIIVEAQVFGANGVPITARRAMLHWGTHQGYLQIKNTQSVFETIFNIGDNADGSGVFVVENIQHLRTRVQGSKLNADIMYDNDKVPNSKFHENLLPEGTLEFLLGDGNPDGNSYHSSISVVAYSY